MDISHKTCTNFRELVSSMFLSPCIYLQGELGQPPTILGRILEVTFAFSISTYNWLVLMQQCMDLMIG